MSGFYLHQLLYINMRGLIEGQKFWRLTIIWINNVDKVSKRIFYKCMCDCWKETIWISRNIKNWSKTSCGCYRSEQAKKRFFIHWMTNSREFRIWSWMINRTTNINSPDYKYYGLRWIKISHSRKYFKNFYIDMWKALPWYTLDRIDNNKWYSKNNCKRSTYKEQAINRNNTIYIEWVTIEKLSEIYWIKKWTIHKRLYNWLSKNKVLSPLKRIHGKRN